MSAEDATVRIRVRDCRMNEHAVAETEPKLIGCRPGLLDAKRNERSRPRVFVQRGIKISTATTGFVIVGDATSQRLGTFVNAVESVELGLRDSDDRRYQSSGGRRHTSRGRRRKGWRHRRLRTHPGDGRRRNCPGDLQEVIDIL